MGELVTFTGIAGGLQSLLTPEFTHGINPIYAFDYYVNHASIIAVGIVHHLCPSTAVTKGRGCATLAASS